MLLLLRVKMLVQTIPRDEIDPNPENARKDFDDREIQNLAVSLKTRQLTPCIVFKHRSRFMLVDGERRWRAALLAGLQELDCIILETAPTKGELLLAQLAIDAHNAHLSALERAHLYADAMRENDLTARRIAA